jgi:hypothetical protein
MFACGSALICGGAVLVIENNDVNKVSALMPAAFGKPVGKVRIGSAIPTSTLAKGKTL